MADVNVNKEITARAREGYLFLLSSSESDDDEEIITSLEKKPLLKISGFITKVVRKYNDKQVPTCVV